LSYASEIYKVNLILFMPFDALVTC